MPVQTKQVKYPCLLGVDAHLGDTHHAHTHCTSLMSKAYSLSGAGKGHRREEAGRVLRAQGLPWSASHHELGDLTNTHAFPLFIHTPFLHLEF